MLSAQIRRRLRRYHAAELSQREMASRFGVTQACVCKWLRKLGLKPATPGGHGTERARANHAWGRKLAWIYERVRRQHVARVEMLIAGARERRVNAC